MNRTLRTAAAAVAFALALGLVWSLSVIRYESEPSETGSFQDFRDAGYFGAQAIVDGNNPYDVDAYFADYPVGQEFPVVPPTYAVLHIPFLLLDLLPAAVVFMLLSIVGMVALAAWSLRLAGFRVSPASVLVVAGALMVSNGGRLTLIFGQATVLWVFASYLAIASRPDREWLGAGALAMAITKPTFGGPLALLLAAWGRVGRALRGLLVATGVALVLVIPIVAWAGGITELIDTLRDNWAFSQGNEGAALETTMARIDVASTVRQFTGWVAPPWVEAAVAAVVFGGSALWLAAAHRRRVSQDLAIVVMCVAVLIGVYHLYYDLVLLALPVLLVLRPSFAGGIPRALRMALTASLLVAAFNVFHSLTFADRVSETTGRWLGPGLTGLALGVALALALLAVRFTPATATESGHSSTERAVL